MEKLSASPIDWASVNWDYLIALVILVFVSSFLGTAISLKRTFLGCVLTTLMVVTGFMFWNYYPHHLPLPTLERSQTADGNVQRPWQYGDYRRDRFPER
jgi:hypothetical protein